jgi:hypothetical protein
MTQPQNEMPSQRSEAIKSMGAETRLRLSVWYWEYILLRPYRKFAVSYESENQLNQQNDSGSFVFY